jgi:hypothetical protein
MKLAIIGFSMAVLFVHSVSSACSIRDKEDVQIGAYKGIQGKCSNNGMPISCIFIEGGSISCDGPGGSYSGDDLNDLIYSACDCSYQEEEQKEEKKELKQYP